jgi:hypothetical protein
MNVAVLQQFLRSLIGPLAANGVGADRLTPLEKVCNALDAYATRPLLELGQFLERSHAYERDGHWPQGAPPLAGTLVDAPTPDQYAARLRKLLVHGHNLSQDANAQLKLWEKAITLPQLRQVAAALGVADSFATKPAGIGKIVAQLTGQSPKTAAATVDEDKVRKLTEEYQTLKAKAERPDGPYEEIEARLKEMEGQLKKKDEAIAVCKRLGVVRTVKSGKDALLAIRHKVFEARRAAESIAY